MKDDRLRVYISGPITGDPDYKEKFERAEREIIKEGGQPILPVGIKADEYNFDHDEFLELDLKLLELCDAIYMMTGWHRSAGAVEEFEKAERMGIPIVFERKEKSAVLINRIHNRNHSRGMGNNGDHGVFDGKERRQAAPGRTREGITRQEAADLELVGAEIEVKECVNCAESKDGRVCDYGDYYGSLAIEGGRCRGFKEKERQDVWVVSYFEKDSAERIVTVFDNEEAADKMVEYLKGRSDVSSITVDIAPIYKKFVWSKTTVREER